MTHWQQITIRTQSATDAETISEYLEKLGAVAITFQDAQDHPLYEPELGTTPLWDNTLVKGLFADSTSMPAILNDLSECLSSLSWSYTLETIAEEDWQNNWKKDFKPLCFGQRLWVVPSWHQPPDPAAPYIYLDPGLAFGTGAHPTTQLCLEWLAQQDMADKIIIDYGCGSGILAIAALKLGAKQAIAVDIDPQALEATRSNAERNHINPAQITTYFPEQLPSIKADVVIANILAKPLMQLAHTLHELCHTNGQLVLSGLLVEQAQAIIDYYAQWQTLHLHDTAEGWGILINALSTVTK